MNYFQSTKIKLKVPRHVALQARKLRIKVKLDKPVRLFENNPRHPGLNFEKIRPHSLNTWSIRLDKQYRARLIRESENCFRLLDVSNHYK